MDMVTIKFVDAYGDSGHYEALLQPASSRVPGSAQGGSSWKGTGATPARAVRRAYKAHRQCMKHQCKVHGEGC